MDLLTIVQTACNELGLEAPSLVVGTTDLQIKQLLALANRDGNELYRSHQWTALSGEHIVNLDTPVNLTGTYTTGGTTITGLSSTAALEAGAFSVSGTGMPTAQRVTAINSATSVECEMEFTADGVASDLIFARDTYELPSDFDRYTSNTWWDRTNHWMLIGPQSAQADQWQRSGIVTTGPRKRWRQIGRKPTCYRLWPPPTATSVPEALVFEFISNGWVEHIDGTFGDSFTADTDVPLINEQMFILGIKWRMWQIKGFAYAALQQEYNDFVNREKARDGGMPDLWMGRRRFGYLITSANVQDGFFPGGT